MAKKKGRHRATDKQKRFMQVLGISFRRDVTKFEAMNFIDIALTQTRTLNKEISQRIARDDP